MSEEDFEMSFFGKLVIAASVFFVLLLTVWGFIYIENNWSKATVVVETDPYAGDVDWVVEISENGKIRTLSGSGREQFLVTGKEVVVHVTYEEFQANSCLSIYKGDEQIYISNFDWIEIDCQDGVSQSVDVVHDTWFDFFSQVCCLTLIGLGILIYQQQSQIPPTGKR